MWLNSAPIAPKQNLFSQLPTYPARPVPRIYRTAVRRDAEHGSYRPRRKNQAKSKEKRYSANRYNKETYSHTLSPKVENSFKRRHKETNVKALGPPLYASRSISSPGTIVNDFTPQISETIALSYTLRSYCIMAGPRYGS